MTKILKPQLDIIVPVYNCLEFTKIFINSLKGQLNHHLIIIDNNSDLETKKYLESLNDAEIIFNKVNKGYLKAVNQGLKISKAPKILLANNDIILPLHSLKRLVNGMVKNKYGIVGPYTNNIGEKFNKLLIKYKFSTKEDLFVYAQKNYRKFKRQTEEVEHILGHCMLITREVFNKNGLLDESYGVGNWEDIDYCYRARKNGFKIGLIKEVFVYHFCHTTFKELNIDIKKLIRDNKNIFNKKWEKI